MIKLLFGSWPRRTATLAVCLLAFATGLTLAMAIAIRRDPGLAPAAAKVPALGALAAALAEWLYDSPTQETEQPADVPTVRELRPLSAEEIGQLIQSLKEQRQIYLDRMQELQREAKRLEMYRQELAKEREEILALRDKVVSQWEEIKKARSAAERSVTEIESLEARNLKQLATSYESMRPEKAAPIVKKLDEATAAKTLFLMKERAAAKIIEQLDHETAAKLTERMALMKSSN